MQLSIACDALIRGVCERPSKASVAFLCTPTDAHVIPKEAAAAVAANQRKVGVAARVADFFLRTIRYARLRSNKAVEAGGLHICQVRARCNVVVSLWLKCYVAGSGVRAGTKLCTGKAYAALESHACVE